MTACNSAEIQDKSFVASKQHIDSAVRLVQAGDLIFRCGKDEISKLFCRLNKKNQNYSHCGVAVLTDSGMVVCHIIENIKNVNGGITFEKIKSFIAPQNNERWAIVRYNISVQERLQCINQLYTFKEQKVRFDQQFDLATNDKLYCSEMLYKALASVTADSNYIEMTVTPLGKKYIAIDNLFQNKHNKTICEITY